MAPAFPTRRSSDRGTRYDHIDPLFRESVDWDLVERHFKDLLQVVVSIRAGRIAPSTLLRKLGNYSRKNRLYHAFKARSEEHTSELQSPMRNSYAVFCLTKKL